MLSSYIVSALLAQREADLRRRAERARLRRPEEPAAECQFPTPRGYVPQWPIGDPSTDRITCMDSTDVKAASRRAGDHPALETAARIGYAVNGVLHIIIGAIALRLAFGAKGASADQSGALGLDGRQRVRPRHPLDRRHRLARPRRLAGHRGHLGRPRDERPAQGRRQGRRLPPPVVDRVPVRERRRLVEQEAVDRLHRDAHDAAGRPVARRGRRPRRHRRRRLPRRQGLEEEVPRRTSRPTRASGSSRPAASATSPRASPSPSSAASSSSPPCGTSPARPAASTARCATCSAPPAVRCCSPSSRSASSPSASTASVAPGTPTSEPIDV